MSRPAARSANHLLAKVVFNDSKISSEEHSEDDYDTPMKEQIQDGIKRQRSTNSSKIDTGGKSPLGKKIKGATIVKSRSLCKSSPSEKPKAGFKMFKAFNKEESSDEELVKSKGLCRSSPSPSKKPKSGFKMFKTFNKEESSDEEEKQKFSFGQTPTKSKSKNNAMTNWLNSSKKVEESNSNCDRENIDTTNCKDKTEENETIDELLESDDEDDKTGKRPRAVNKEILKVRDSSSKKKSSLFNDVSSYVDNYHRDKSDDEDIKEVNEMSLEPLDNSYKEKKRYTIPRKEKDKDNEDSDNKGDANKESGDKLNKGELNFDRKIKSATKNNSGAKSNETVVNSILKKGSISSASSVESTEDKTFKFPSHLKPVPKSKSSGKKAKTGSDVLESIPDEDGTKPMWYYREEAENKRKRGEKSKSKQPNKKRGSSVFDDSDDNDVPKKSSKDKNGSSVFEEEDDCDKKVQKTGSSIFDYEDPPDVVKLMERDANKSGPGFKKHAKRRQSMAKMAKRSVTKGGRADSTESEEELIKKPVVKRKPRRKKNEIDDNQKNINQFFKPTPGPSTKSKPESIPSPTKRDNDEDSDEELNEEYVPDLDELLKMPERPADGSKTVDEMCDEWDKQIAERQRAHEEEMEKVDIDIEEMKRKRTEKKARMKENAKRRNILETNLTESKLRELFKQNLEHLQGVWDGKVESSRHKAFHQSIRTRHALYYMMITDPFTDEQLDWTLDEIEKVWMKTKEEHRKNNEYVWKVLLAECFIKFYMDLFEVSKEEAVQMISETPLHKKDRLKDMRASDESDNSDSD